MNILLVLLSTTLNFVSGGDVRVEFRKALAKFAEKDHINLAESQKSRISRFKSFAKFHARVEEINSDDSRLFTAEDNFLSILTPEERQGRLGLNTSMQASDDLAQLLVDDSPEETIPDHIDFGDVISDIKDQGDCGSCWTFAGTGTMEGEIYFTTGHRKVDLSEREFLECSTATDGCNGGFVQWCIKYAIKMGRIAPTEAYPYEELDRRECKASGTTNALVEHNVKVVGMRRIPPQKLLVQASKHVVAVAVYVNEDFMSYKKGIYMDDNCQEYTNHAVALVGYGERSGHRYWKIRNSWGTQWGENGYILMDREVENICKIRGEAFMPVMKCRDDSCVAPDPNEGSSGKEDEAPTEEKSKVCFKPINLGGCQRSLTQALKACIESGIKEDQCWVFKDKNKKKCFMGTTAGSAVRGMKLEMVVPCSGEKKEEGDCIDAYGLGGCKSSKEEALKTCLLNGNSALNCMVVQTSSSCFKGTVNQSVTSGGMLQRSPRCEEDATEPPTRDCSINFGPGVVYCRDCNCCTHKNFCSDYKTD